jgi:hypothetical protein
MASQQTEHHWNFQVFKNSVKNSKFRQDSLRTTLMHECLHDTVERRGRRGNPFLNIEVEHFAMGLLGDIDQAIEKFPRNSSGAKNFERTDPF